MVIVKRRCPAGISVLCVMADGEGMLHRHWLIPKFDPLCNPGIDYGDWYAVPRKYTK